MKKAKLTTLLTLVLMVMMITLVFTPLAANAASKEGRIAGCNIRTTQSVTSYKNATSNKAVGSIPKNKKMAVIKEKNGRFQVNYKGKKVWIKQQYTLVNVKQYIPSITVKLDMSKKKNLFNFGGKDIKGLTDQTLYKAKGSKKGMECWLRYETAQKLLKVQKQMDKDGYTLVIYDAYRPYDVTVKIRNAFSKYLRGISYQTKSYWFGYLNESCFLAQGVSSHNYGIAVDVTLMKNGKELEMPSKMHALDKRAAFYYWSSSKSKQSTKNATYLRNTMLKCGMSDLSFEWWHFQDNQTTRYGAINIPN